MKVNKRVISVEMHSNEHFAFGYYTGNYIRSAIISRLHDTYCTKKLAHCDTCTNSSCILKNTILFKGENSGKLLLNPMYIECKFVDKDDYILTRKIQFNIVLLGEFKKHTDDVVSAISELVFSNSEQKVRFKVTNVDISDSIIDTTINDTKYNGKVRLTFQSYIYKPINKTKNTDSFRVTNKLQFNNFIRACTHRVTSLLNTCCDGERFDYKRFTDKDYPVEIVENNIKDLIIERASSRTNTKKYLRALTGSIVYKGDIDEAYDLIKLVSEINIGKESTIGFGKFSIEKVG